eukprot:COSAG06_NODE_7607_length_2443_cov_2.545648_3_plen_120_part_00
MVSHTRLAPPLLDHALGEGAAQHVEALRVKLRVNPTVRGEEAVDRYIRSVRQRVAQLLQRCARNGFEDRAVVRRDVLIQQVIYPLEANLSRPRRAFRAEDLRAAAATIVHTHKQARARA